MYKVIKLFADLQDKNHVYSVGSVYPRDGFEPTQQRIDELESGKNQLGVPLIEAVEEEKPTRSRRKQ